jgi:hypothetical protein
MCVSDGRRRGDRRHAARKAIDSTLLPGDGGKPATADSLLAPSSYRYAARPATLSGLVWQLVLYRPAVP